MRSPSFVRMVAFTAGLAALSCSSATAPNSLAGRHAAGLDSSLGAVITLPSPPVAYRDFEVVIRTGSGGGCQRPAGIEVEYVSANEAVIVPFVAETSRPCPALLGGWMDYRVTLRFLDPAPATIRVGSYQLNVTVGI